uniref:Aquaporin-1 n=1 Tax=Canis lupus familiaris TaxID=9615 RepID=A0A8C0MSM3_CANLF
MASEFKKKLFWRAVVAEFLAMILFVFISIGSALGFNYPVRNNQTAGAAQDNVKVSLAFGLSIATLAQSVGHISGAHLNPAVTLGLLLSCQISILRAVMYIIAQCVGAIVATAILSGITSSLPDNSLGRNELAPGVNSGQGLGIEIIGTLQLVLCVLATTDRRRRDLGGSGPLAIGLSVALGHLLAIDYTGCGINPARSFGSSVITHNFKDHWVRGRRDVPWTWWEGLVLNGSSNSTLRRLLPSQRLWETDKAWKWGQQGLTWGWWGVTPQAGRSPAHIPAAWLRARLDRGSAAFPLGVTWTGCWPSWCLHSLSGKVGCRGASLPPGVASGTNGLTTCRLSLAQSQRSMDVASLTAEVSISGHTLWNQTLLWPF